MGKYLDSLKTSVLRNTRASNPINLNNLEQLDKLGFLGSQDEHFNNSDNHHHQVFSWWRLRFLDQSTKDCGYYPPATHKRAMEGTGAINAVAIMKGPEGLQSPDQWGHWSEAEANTAMDRARVFAAKGLDPIEAETLACSLVTRDRSGDDRLTCAECANWIAGRCKTKRYPLGDSDIYTLHRCDGFET